MVTNVINEIITNLTNFYQIKLLLEHYKDPFEILVSTVLSQRARDENTYKATEQLFNRYSTPKKLANATIEDIKSIIGFLGLYETKSKRINEIAKIIVDQYDGKVPNNINDLLALPGVGRKTANCVLSYGFGKDAIAVDTHVHRISNRLGLVNTKKPEDTEMGLKKIVPKKSWSYINTLFVKHGKEKCKPISPECKDCIINNVCKTYKSGEYMKLKRK